MRTANPALNESVFQTVRGSAGTSSRTMTINGAVNKTAILLALLFCTALISWNLTYARAIDDGGTATLSGPLIWIGLIGGLVLALVTIFKKTWAPFTAPLYALFEGLLLGGISALFEMKYEGIVLQAVLGTFGTLGALLMAYRSGLIRVTENFRLGIVAATGGIALIYLISIGLGFFGISIPLIHENGIVGIAFSAFVVTIAALNLVLDFDFIEKGAEAGAPKFMEWYAAFGLMVTLVWLYIEMLRLLSKIRSR